MKKIITVLCVLFMFLGCKTINTRTEIESIEKSERLFNYGLAYFRQNKFLEALGPLYEASFYRKKDLAIRCYIGVCISFIEESERGRKYIDEYLAREPSGDPYLLSRISSVYSEIYREPDSAMRILDRAIELDQSRTCEYYINKGYLYLTLRDKEAAARSFRTAFEIAKKSDNGGCLETAPQLLEQIDGLYERFGEER